MKSLALSLFVAAGLSLGAASAAAETPQVVTSATATIAKIQEATRLAGEHAERARQYRHAARVESEAARNCLRIAADNDKQGFAYYANMMREKAAKHQRAALANQNAAEREESLARHYRAQAHQYLAPKPVARS